jgi:transcriptional regulator with XRE-family HTH domain
MPRDQLSPRFILAKNIRALLEHHSWSERDMGKHAGIDPKTVNNLTNQRVDARQDMVQAIAKACGISVSQLMDPEFDPASATSPGVKELIALYAQADERGKENILRVAQMAAGK